MAATAKSRYGGKMVYGICMRSALCGCRLLFYGKQCRRCGGNKLYGVGADGKDLYG